MTSTLIDRADVPRVIGEQGHRIFAVLFIKRTTGERRHMLCRQRVRKHLRGGAPAYGFASKGLASVFDLRKMDYRAIPYEGVLEIRASGRVFRVRRKAKVTA